MSLTLNADNYPKREMRSAWVATVFNLDWPRSGSGSSDYTRGTTSAIMNTQKAQLESLITNLKAAGFNAVNFQIRSFCDAMYKSRYEPWSVYLTNKRGTAPYNSWDPLAYCIELCHANGMECHAWVNPFRFSTASSTSSSYPSTALDQERINNGWILEYVATSDTGTKSYTSVLNPGLEAVRDYIVESVCKEIVQNYDIDGMVWDDYFYPNGIPTTEEAGDYDLYTAYTQSGGTMSMADWRRENVNTTVKQAYDMIQLLKPYVKFGISPAGVANQGAKANGLEIAEVSSWGYQYNGIFADPCKWIINGYIDYISPQLYWTTSNASAPFEPLSKWWNNLAKTYGVGCYVSHDIAGSTSTWSNSAEDYAERNTQISYNRQAAIDNNPGSVFYSSSYISGPRTSGFGTYLKTNFYQYPSLTPRIVRDGEDAKLTDPGKVANLSLSSSTLSWTAISGFYNMRYAVYAIPTTVGRTDAASDVHTNDGGFKAEYLIDVTYGSTMTGVPTGDYWYAVTAVDCYGNEWAAATINEPSLGDAQISLSEPADNSTLTFSDNSFSWTSDGESFKFQISTSSDFQTTVTEQETTGKSVTVSPDDFTDGTTYYWRVQASKSGYNSVWSEVRTFTMETRPSIGLALVSPAASATTGAESETFTWNGVDGATYTFEIAEYTTFANPIVTQTSTDKSYTLDVTSLAANKDYYWRVSATKEGYIPATSVARKFTTPKKQSVSVDGITIEELWVQSLNNGNFPSQLSNCTSARSMAAYEGNVYVLERTSDTECSLLMFNGETGAYVKTIALTGDIYTCTDGTAISGWAYKPGNCVFTDGAGNLCISCLNVTSELKPLTVCTVDVSTGVTTSVFESALTSSRYRIDYANASGDVTATGGQIWAATNTDQVLRWTRTSSGTWTMESTTIAEFYPAANSSGTAVTALGTAPSIQPVSSSQFVVDGANTHPTFYTFSSGSTATLNSSFAANPTIQPAEASFNGTYSITIGNTPLFIYVDDNNQSSGHSFSIVANKGDFDFSQLEFMQSIPENKLGNVNHAFALDQPVAINNSDGSVTVFIYAPSNGLAAYRLRLPELEAVTLVSPDDAAKLESSENGGTDFTWSAIEGATYTIEFSTTSAFATIAASVTTESNSVNSTSVSLESETLYYWRVKASKPGYSESTSAVRSFTSADKPTWAKPELGYPADNAEISSDTPFTATKTSDVQYIEIATDANFSDIYLAVELSATEYIFEKTWYEYTMPISLLANGTYYWRSRAVSSDISLGDGISAVRAFTVYDSFDTSTDYKMVRENYNYDSKTINSTSVSMTNNWIRSATYGNGLTQANGGNFARGFCVRPDIDGDQDGLDIIYITCDDNTSPFRLERFNAATGEQLESLKLSTNVATSTYGCIGCFLDDACNVCVHNLSLANGTLQICSVDPSTGTATEVFSKTVPARVDHCRVVGDVTSGNFFVFAASGSVVYRWSVDLGTAGDPEATTIGTYYPTSATTFGTNAMVFPVDDSYYYADGLYTDFTLYSFGESSPVGTFAGATAAAPSMHDTNGGAFFSHNSKPFVIYPYQGRKTEHRYNITAVTSHTGSFSGASVKWTVPGEENALPASEPSGKAYCALADYLPKAGVASRSVDPNSTTVFMYVPGSGLASYTLTNYIYTGAAGAEMKPAEIDVTVTGGVVNFGARAERATLYTVSGVAVAYAEGEASSIAAPQSSGVYILQLTVDGEVSNHKLVIK